MPVYPLMLRHGHLLVARDGGVDLIDTGSPITIPALPIVHEHVGPDVTRIVGTDLLAGEVIEINFAAMKVSFGAEPNEDAQWTEVGSLFGVPTLTVGTPWGEVAAILDSGAPLAYGPGEMMRDVEATEVVTDFHPTNGVFETQVRIMEISIQGRAVSLRVGELPQSVGTLLAAFSGPKWIIGPEAFVGRRLLLDLGKNRIADLPEASK